MPADAIGDSFDPARILATLAAHGVDFLLVGGFAAEAHELGLEEALDVGAALIEWPERLGNDLPPNRLDIELSIQAEGRRALATPHGSWTDREVEH